MCSKNLHIAVISFPLLLGVLIALPIRGQENFGSIDELKEKAQERFEEKKFVKAMPLYSQLLSHKPEDPIYNYKYGVCALYGESDKEIPLKHLKYAAKKEEVPPPVHYYLGRTYHLNYRFEKAIASYNRFMEKGDPDDLPVERKLEMAKDGKALMQSPNELVVLDKTRTDTNEFFRYYEPQGVSGQILVAPKDIMKEADQERNERSIVFFPNGSKTIYYASYGTDGANGKDLYKVRQLPTGEWAEPQKLKGAVNTEFDEDYPFKLPNSRNLYFCSKGHNSMGGYDIFRSRYDKETNSYGPPENLDFPINSPDDDILYLADEAKRSAYFASGRSSDAGHLHVYKVRIKKIPMRTAILKGQFKNEVDSTQKKARIVVKNAKTGKKVGVYNSSPENGEYLITVPKSGKYKFLVQPGSSEYEHEGTVEVPRLEEIRPLKQTLLLTQKKGREQLVIKNRFDERFENEDQIVSQVMKQKAKLDKNDSKAMRKKLAKARKKSTEKSDTAAADTASAKEEELISEAQKEAEELEKKAVKTKKKSQKAYAEAQKAQEEAKKASQKADSLLKEAKNSSDPEVKEKKLAQADSLQKKAADKTEEARTALALGDDLAQKAEQEQKAANKARNYANELQKALEKAPREKALQNTSSEKKALTQAKKKARGKDQGVSSLHKEETRLEEKADQHLERGRSKRNREKAIEDRLSSLDRQIPQASGQEEEKLRQERKELQKELKQVQRERDSAFALAEKNQDRADRKAERAELLDKLEQGQQGTASASTGDKEWSSSERKELRNAIERTEKKTKERSRDPSLVKHRQKKGEERALADQKAAYEEPSSDEGRADEGQKSDTSKKEGRASARGGTAQESPGTTEQKKSRESSFSYEDAAPSTQKAVGTADPSYKEDVEAIRKQEDLDKSEKRERIQERKRELDKKVRESIDEKEQALKTASDPKQKNRLKRELEDLRQAQNKIAQDLKSRSSKGSRTASRQGSESKEAPGSSSKPSSFELDRADPKTKETVRSVDPGYEEDIGAIRDDRTLDRSEKDRRIRKRQQKLADKLDQRIEERKNELDEAKDSSQKAEVKKELKQLKELRQDLPESSELASAPSGQKTRARGNESSDDKVSEKSGKGGDKGSGSVGGNENESSVSSDLSKKEESLIQKEAPSYRKDMQRIEDSDKARVKKDQERAQRTEALVDSLEEQISRETQAMRQMEDPKKIEKTSKKIETLRKLRDKKEKEADRYRARAIGSEPDLASGSAENETGQEGTKPGTEKPSKNRRGDRTKGKSQKNASVTEPDSEKDAITERIDPSYRSDMDSIETEGDPNSPTVYQKKAEREQKTGERIAKAIDSTRQALQESQDPQERQRLTQRLEDLHQARTRSREKRERYRAYSKPKEEEAEQPAEELRNSYERDQKALEANDELSGSERKQLEQKRRKELISRADQRIKAEKKIRKKADQGAVRKKAEKRISELKQFKKELQKENKATASDQEKGEEAPKKEAPDRARERISQRTNKSKGGKVDTQARRQLAQKEAKKARSYANRQRAKAMRIRDSLEKSSSSEEKEQGAARKRVQAMVLTQKADSAQRMAQAYEDISGKEGEEDAEGEVLAMTDDAGKEKEGGDREKRSGGPERTGGEEEGKKKEAEQEKPEEEGTEGSRGTQGGDESNAGKKDRSKGDGGNGTGEGDENTPQGKEGDSEEGGPPDEEATERGSGNGNENRSESGGQEKRSGNTDEEEGGSTPGKEESGPEKEAGGGKAPPKENAPEEKSSEGKAAEGGDVPNSLLYMEDPKAIRSSKGDVYTETKGSPYSEEKPIPKDPKMPEGVIYQVQVGAFRTSIPQDHFKGFAPLIGKTGNDGITRYRAGFFKSRESAVKARNRIREKGYPKAFVVAYDGGERIPVNRAEERSSGTLASEGSGSDESPRESSTGSKPLSPTSVEQKQGLFFTVQVGVYSDPLEEGGPLDNIAPLYVKETEKGYYRYSTGTFSSVENGRNKLRSVKDKGIGDAFITAYHQGKRISIDRAKSLIDQEGRGVLAKEEGSSEASSERTPGTKKRSEKKESEEGSRSRPERSPEELPEDIAPSDIDIKVDLGTYGGKVPNKVAQAILEHPDASVKERETGEGTNFRSRAYDSLRQAAKVRHRFAKAGIKKARVITLVDGKQIPRKKAVRILDKGGESTDKEQGSKEEGSEKSEAASESGTAPKESDTSSGEKGTKKEESGASPEESGSSSGSGSGQEKDTARSGSESSTAGSEPDREKPASEIAPSEIDIKVDLGTYEGKVPNKVAQAILENPDANVKERETDKGSNFRSRAYDSLRQAAQVRHRFAKAGVDQARVITLVDGERISRKKAARILERSSGKLEKASRSDQEPSEKSGTSPTETEASKEKRDTASEAGSSSPSDSLPASKKDTLRSGPDTSATSSGSVPDTTSEEIAPEDIRIKVDLGTYKGKVPNEVAQAVFNNSGKKIEKRKTEEGTN
ncbi:MAG: SPOR domain-containing protein, partial [Flavobacteriales bacterium]